ncbi:helix-turn-helix domain-containing protein [Geothrix sp. 21YS21S-4]|uniref:helix-turn-helix domain-containing protein n=1 Tax=Geothrix sp. 21YS21S-4 TaxID=3068889 RepID=UPI0027B8A068|nr:helix-turn-helix domain-containing protein [Geothrix sp. 21YS21S-4]
MTDRKWFKIGEAATQVGVGPKDLRYWEEVIPDIRPRRSKGNLRYYHVDELPRLKRIKGWLAEGLTVADCAELLAHGHLVQRLDLGLDGDELPAAPAVKTKPAFPRLLRTGSDLQPILKSVRALYERLSAPPKS